MAVLSLTNFTGGEISPLLSGRADLGIYSSSCSRMENFIPLVHGPAIRRSGFRFIGACKDTFTANDPENPEVRLIPYSYSVDDSYILEMGHKYFRVITENGYIEKNGKPAEYATPYLSGELFQLSFAQAGKDLYIAHKNHEPRAISFSGDEWACSKLNYSSPSIAPHIKNAYLYQAPDGSKNPLVRDVAYAVSILDKNGRQTEMSAPSETIKSPAAFDFENYGVIVFSQPAPEEEIFIYRIVNGIPAYIGRAKNNIFKDMGLLEADYTKLPPKLIHSFTEKDDRPSKVAFFDGRLVFAGSVNEPNAVWGSVTGDYTYFAAKETPSDSCAWKFILDSGQVNGITWLFSASKLLIGTEGAEWRMSGSGGGAITPNSVEARRETSWGSAELRALSAGQDILFVDKSGKNVRTFAYVNSSAGYSSVNLSVYAEHMTRNTKIIDWDYAPTPHSVVWAVTEDGGLLGLTYDQDQRVAAWHRHTTDGSFKSAAVMSGKGRDSLFAVIERNVGGKKRKYVEMLEKDFTGKSGEKADEAFFVDSGLTYSGEPTKNISGLSHLEGKTVSILADGAVHPMRKVSPEGTITLDYPASLVHAGLQYDSALETMPVEAMMSDGISQSRKKRISEIAVRLENTIGLLAGTNREKLIRIPFRDSQTPMGSAPRLFTGDKKIAVKGGYDTDASAAVVQDQPLPMTVVAIFPRIRYGTR